MVTDGRVAAEVQGHGSYRTGVAPRGTRPGPVAGSHAEAEGRGPATPVRDVGRGARALNAGERLSAHGRRGLDTRAAKVDVRLDRAREEGERLEVRVAELSGAGRIRALATEKLGMHEPKSATMKVYGGKAEDGTHHGAPQKGGR